MAAIEVDAAYVSSLSVVDVNGVATDAGTVVLTITLPDQTTVNPAVTHSGTGSYSVTYTLAQEGLYKFQWVTTGPATSKTDYVPVNAFRSIVALDDVKSFVNFDSAGGKENLLRQMMMSATELIEEIVGTCVIRTFTDERVIGRTAQVIRLSNGPLPNDTSVTSVTSVWNGGPTWTQANGDFIVYPDSATVELSSFLPFYFGPWKATYIAGRTIIPQKIQLAALEICYDLWSTQRPYGMDSLEPGPEETARWEMMINTYKIPPHAMELLMGEERPGFC